MRISDWSSDVCSSDLVWLALLPALIQVSFHLVEANAITPLVLGRRLTMNPLLILVSLSFWGWVWGTPGALLAVPLLIILQTVIAAAGQPDIAGFLFEHGPLMHRRSAERHEGKRCVSTCRSRWAPDHKKKKYQ